MADMLERGAAYLEARRDEVMTRAVVYQRGVARLTIQATVGRTVFEETDANGAYLRTESRDFLVLAADLVVGGAAVRPEAGDRIEEISGDGKTYVYEVLAPGREPCWLFADAYRITLRIHTKQVEAPVKSD